MLDEILVKLEKEEQENIEQTKKRFEERRTNLASGIKKFESLGKLGERVLELTKDYGSSQLFYASLHVTKDDFRIIKQAFGRLEKSYVNPIHGKRRTVSVTLKPVDPIFRGVSFTYQHKLKKTDKCKVVKVSSREVQCSV